MEQIIPVKVISKLIVSFFVGSCVATAYSQVLGGGGSSSSSPWILTYDRIGTSTCKYPKWDSSIGSYRIYTFTKDWATEVWTQSGAMSFPNNASWNTPTAFTGSVEDQGMVRITATWNGTGAPPSYMYIAITSSACCGELAEDSGASCSGSNGQGDPFVVTSSGAYGYSAGTHAKKLKVGTDNTATYTISLSANSSKTSKIGNLGSSVNAVASLDPKAVGVVTDATYFRDEINIGTPVVRRILVESPDFDSQTCVIGAQPKWEAPAVHTLVGGTVDRTYGVARLGNWVKRNEDFSSSVDEGSKFDVFDGGPLWDMFYVSGVRHTMDISLADLLNMRTTPKHVKIKVQTTDPYSTIPGSFSGTMNAEIWAPARLRGYSDYTAETDWAEPVFEDSTKGNTMRVQLENIGDTATISFSISHSDTYSFPVNLSTGVTFGGDLFGFLKATVKADISRQVGDAQGFTITGGTSFQVGPCVDPTEEWGIQTKTRTYMRDRFQSSYDDQGYNGDFMDTINNTQPANILSRKHLFRHGGGIGS